MDDVIVYLNTNSGGFSVILSLSLVITTFIYIWLTRRIVKETTKMRKAQTDAKVCIRLEPKPDAIQFLILVLVNEGMGAANNISFKLEAIPPTVFDNPILNRVNELAFIKRGIDYLSPKQEVKTLLFNLLDGPQLNLDTQFRIHVSYSNTSKEIIKDTYFIDTSLLKGIRQLGKSDLKNISEHLKEINKQLNSLTSQLIKITSHAPKYIERDKEIN